MRGNNIAIFLVLVAIFASCSAGKKDIEGVDWNSWKSDKNGCQNKRQAVRHEIEQQRDRLKSLSEMDIVALMGRPDQTELLKRNQKSFTYFLQGGPDCATADTVSLKLIIRFNAMGLAKEVALQ